MTNQDGKMNEEILNKRIREAEKSIETMLGGKCKVNIKISKNRD